MGKGIGVLVSSYGLANKLIFDTWGITAAQRKKYESLFARARKESLAFFDKIKKKKKFEWINESERLVFRVSKFDELSKNLILGFEYLPRDKD